MRLHGLGIVALSMALQPAVAVPIAWTEPFVAHEPCVGDQNDDGAVSVGELIHGVAILLGEDYDFCEVFDANRNGQVALNEVIIAVDNALHGCGVLHRENFSDFRQFHFTRQSALGFCPRLNAVHDASIRVDAGGFSLQLSILEEGQRGVDDCLRVILPRKACFVARSQPTRYLQEDEIARVLETFRSVVVRDTPNPVCRGCIIDPCLINAARWDAFAATDYICAQELRLDEAQVAEIVNLLEELRTPPICSVSDL